MTTLSCSASGIFAICCDLTRPTTTRLARTSQSTRTRRSREQYVPLVALCPRHFLADSIICMCVFDFRQAQQQKAEASLNAMKVRVGSRTVMLAASKSRQLCLRKETGARPAKSVAKGTTAVMARIASWIRRSQSRAAPILRERGDTPSKRSSLSSTGAEAGGSVDIS